MALAIYQATVPALLHGLNNLSAIVEKGAAYAIAMRVDPIVMCGLRLTAAMMPLSRQVSAACDAAKYAVARLSNVEAIKHEDNEKTFAELQSRTISTRDYVCSVPEQMLDGIRVRKIELVLDGIRRELDAEVYLTQLAVPNFYFHISMAYAILRMNGVSLTKQDFEGTL